MGEMKMMYVILIFIIFLLICAFLILYLRFIKTLDNLDSMLDKAIANTFSETEFTEKRLSKIETKMWRYLSIGKTSLAQINAEKDMIKSLISDISHQTKTPISNILLYSQLLSDTEGLNANMRELVSHIEIQTEKLNFLISSLIKVSRLENGIISITPKENSVKKLLASIDFSQQANKKCIDLTVENNIDITALFDYKWTLEAISNIIDNAIKYTQTGGTVNVSATPYEMFVKIDITDTGIGISEEDTSKIFTRFYRSPKVNDEKGVGIGLYLSREIISKQGGYIKVTSTENKGSTFSVFIPQKTNMSKL